MAKTYEGAVNMHKLLASGASPQVEAKGKSVIQKYAKGGAVMNESKVALLPARGSAPQPLEKATGTKIATYKNGGNVGKKGMGLTIAIGIPVKKASGRGR
jgi:hypothetical protein